VQYNGSQLGGMAKSRAGVNKPDVEAMVGQHHLFFFAEGLDELTEELVMEKIKKSAGANYDLGSNSKGYESKVCVLALLHALLHPSFLQPRPLSSASTVLCHLRFLLIGPLTPIREANMGV